jgi:hypothetical protein
VVKCDLKFDDEDMRGKTEEEQKKAIEAAQRNESTAHQKFAAFYA